MVGPKFYCSCDLETTNQNEITDHLEANRDHIARVKYLWMED